jgi:hypothetical protein
MTRKGRAAILPSILVAMVMLAGVAFAASVSVTSSSPSQVLASEPNEIGYPFILGAVRDADNNIVPILTYNIGSNPGTVPMDGTVYDHPIEELFAKYDTYPVSDHPDGTAYFWIYDDLENVYFVADWTSDNTYDDGEDYFTVHINDGTGVKAYTQNSDGGEYGQALFASTAMMEEDHMYYIIAVPKAELSSETLKVGFELYGTATFVAETSWNEAPKTGTVGSAITYSVNYDAINPPYSSHVVVLVEYDTLDDLNEFLGYAWFKSDGFYKGEGELYKGNVKEIARAAFNTSGSSASGTVNIKASFDTVGEHNLAALMFYIPEPNSGFSWLETPLTVTTTISEGGLNTWMIVAIIAAVAVAGVAGFMFLRKKQ